MKRWIAFALCACLALGLFTACAGDKQPEEMTAPTQSPEEAAVFKILMIGQSHAQDSVWLLQKVLKAELPDREFMVVDVYQPLSLAEHIVNIKADAAVYDYCICAETSVTVLEGYRIDVALQQEQWDLVIFNEATWPQTDERQHTDGDIRFMKDYIRQYVGPECKLAYNATWAQPVSALLYAEGRANAPDSFRGSFVSKFGGDRLAHFDRLCHLITTYEEQDPDFDYVFHSGTAIQYASETHGVPEADVQRSYDLYRDYTHLSDFGRLMVAYQIYAQIFSPEGISEVHVDLIEEELRATSRERAYGDLEITDRHKQAIIASVNYALESPNQPPEQTARPEAVLEAIN